MVPLLLILAVTVTMFRIGDPCCLLLLCLLAGLGWKRPCFRLSGIDVALVCICLYDAVDFCLHPYRGAEAAEASLTGLCCYFLIRSAPAEGFLKLLLLPVGAALALTFVSFGMFAGAVQGAGFADTYPFRFLFRPLGYITNAWASVWLAVLGLLAVGYVRVPRWRIGFGLCWMAVSVALLLSFSRGAFLAWGVCALLTLFALRSWKLRATLLAACLCIGAGICLLFPAETATTLAMNKTASQRQSTESRVNATEKAIDVWRVHPWTGTGNGSYTLSMDKALNEDTTRAYTTYAPNPVVQLLVEKGMAGIVLYGGLYIAVLVQWWKNRKDETACIVAACLIAVGLKEMTMSIALADAVVLVLLYVLLGILDKETQMNADFRRLDNNKKSAFICANLRFLPLSVIGIACIIGFNIVNFRVRKDKEITKQAVEALEGKRYAEAAALLEKVSERKPAVINRAVLAAFIPDSLLPEGYAARVEKDLAREDDGTDVYVAYLQARLEAKRGDFVSAIGKLQGLAEAYPRNATFAYELGCMLFTTADTESHREIKNECPQFANVGAYRIRPDAPTYPRGRFRAYAIRPYRQFGKMRTFIIKNPQCASISSVVNETVCLLRRALQLSPRLLHTERMLAILASDSLFKEQVTGGLASGLVEMEQTANAYARAGSLAYYQGKPDEAEDYLRKAVAEQPGYTVPWLLLGRISEAEGREEEAASCYRKYNLRVKGAFSNSDKAMERESMELTEQEVLLKDYAVKFQNWYRARLLL
ncbi:O-antigen ligase family protein [Phocaeicola salanitronis]|uniref:O-antigen ligase family protein n=1 Tax=Phocaeicola salanitronis TaxID=376805 RepID=UPI00320A1E15